MVVLNEVTGEVMSSRWFDTYESKLDNKYLMDFLKGLKDGRIICFTVRVTIICHSKVAQTRHQRMKLELRSQDFPRPKTLRQTVGPYFLSTFWCVKVDGAFRHFFCF